MSLKNVLVLSLFLGLATTVGAQEKSRLRAFGEKALASPSGSASRASIRKCPKKKTISARK